MKLLLAMALLFVISSFGHSLGQEVSMSPISSKDMSRLNGLYLRLIDEHTVEELSFNENGLVAATFGTKGGPICAPLLYWSLSKKGVLRITGDGGVSLPDWTAIGFVKGEVWVRSEEKIEKYTIVKRQSG